MVRIHAKQKHSEASDQQQFLYDCDSTCGIDEIALELARISNLQAKIHALAIELQPLLLPFHGDPKAISLVRALSEAKSYASMNQLVYNKPLSYHPLRNHVKAIDRELSSVSPLPGIPDLDQFRRILTDWEYVNEDTIQLLWAGKVMDKGKRLSDYIGTNEKTKIVLKLQSPDSYPA
ncbi:hypothetical protein FNV43_RR24903 [Rhamnella rubrinervis]|uniref:Uncharacterized protein n=1 Tax=Rhamnella rubrinervis TaxID=2594499 RepID=A0A8K0DU13_9ROSA|nr:hypothetical protein FNV43_RR24903 [Rhamnella rubrinervis]